MEKDSFFSLFSPVTYGGAIAAGAGWLTLTEWLALGGFAIAVGGFLVNFWHKKKVIQLARERFEWEKENVKQNKG